MHRRGVLLLRGLALGLALLLLWNPSIPGEDRAVQSRPGVEHWLVLDPHPLSGASGSLQAAAARARAVGAEAMAGPRGEALAVWRLEEAAGADGREGAPEDVGAEGLDPLARTLGALVEAGGRRFTVLTPLRGSPDTLVSALVQRGRDRELMVVVEALPSPVRNAGLVRVELPARVEPEADIVEGTAYVALEGVAPGTPVTLSILSGVRREAEGGELGEGIADLARSVFEGEAEASDPMPPGGYSQGIRIPFTLPGPAEAAEAAEAGEETGSAVFEVALQLQLEGDGWPADDTLSLRIEVGPPRGGLLLLSLHPDAEFRALLPLLERATGLEGEGWLRVGEDRFISVGREGEPLVTASADALSDALARSRLLVLQGREPWPASWVPAIAEHPRILRLVRGPDTSREPDIGPTPDPGRGGGGGAGAGADSGLDPGPSGGWGVDPAIPASPIRGFLTGTLDAPGVAGLLPLLPPLEHAPTASPPGAVEALRLRRGSETRAGVLLHRGPDGEREALIGMVGGWRWAAREDEAARFWRALWGGLAAWALEGDGPDLGAQHGSRSDPPFGTRVGNPLPLAIPLGDLAARIEAAGKTATGIGEEGVPVALDHPGLRAIRLGGDGGSRVDEHPPRRPLRSHPAPWLAVLLLLSAEWVLRRRVGLR